MAIIAKYKFNSSLCADYLPEFNSQFTGYTKTDVDNGDGTITRTISHDTLKPTFMRFGVKGAVTDREKSLLEVIECDTSQVTSMAYMFNSCSSLTSLDLSSFDTSKVTSMVAMFQNCSSLTTLDLSNFNTSNVTSMGDMFKNCSKLTLLDLSSFNTSNVTAMNSMFDGCASITTLVLSNFDTSKVTSMWGIFYNCSSLTTLDLSNFNTSNVTSMANMFNSCNKLISLDLSSFDTSKVTGMGGMFGGCSVTDVGLLYATSSTINTLLTHLGTSVARNIYYIDAPLNELTVQNNITYKEYKITKATLPYTLNKLPNGVADYIDVVNKVHVQRVGKVVLDGTQGYSSQSWGQRVKYSFNISGSKAGSSSNINTICDKLPTKEIWTEAENGEYIFTNGDNNISIVASDVTTLYPITVLYELKTPIYTPLTEEQIAQLPLSAYADGYVNLSSDQLTPSFEFRMRASNRYQVDMLETGYYYLNAPVGNVKLGTANVDVQHMPCIVKVDNVGTGDSGYRLGFNGGETIVIDNPKSTIGYWIDENGILQPSKTPDKQVLSDFIEVPDIVNSIIVTDDGMNKRVSFFDENKNFIKANSVHNNKGYFVATIPNRPFKYIRIDSFDCKDLRIKAIINPITLAKLPSHRIPTTFTQGMKCGTNFGYWEGIKEAQTYGVQTANKTTIGGFGTIELYGIEIGGSFIEDEFDISIGKLTKRIGVKKLVGIEDWKVVGSVLENSVLFQLSMDGVMAEANTSTNYVFNDKYPRKTGDRLWSTETYGVGGTTDVIRIRLNLPYRTVDEFKRFLSLNPITVYYRLRVPEITYLTPQFSQMEATNSSTRINVLKNSANNKLFPQCKPSHLTYPVPSLVGNREYTVVHNRKNITGSTKPITLDLGGTQVELNNASGKTLVKTPSSLKHSSLIFIGGESTVDHVMVLDGDWTNKPIEYFENMKGHDTDAIITIMGDGKIDDVAEQYLW